MSTVRAALDWLYMRGMLPAALAAKTEDYYRRVLRRVARGLYDGTITEDEALDRLMTLVEDQLLRGIRQGLRDIGRDPDDVYNDGTIAALYDEMVENEHDHLLDLLDAIKRTVEDAVALSVIYERLEIWANRYNDAVNRARLAGADGDVLLVWHLGPTKEHCVTCAALDGKVARASVWRATGYHPQSPPNPLLECGGWRCQCTLSLAEPGEEENWDGTL